MRRVVFGILGVAVGTSLLVGAKSHQPGPAATMPVARAGAAHLPAGTYLVTGSIQRTPHRLVQLRIRVVGGRVVDNPLLPMPGGGPAAQINQPARPLLRPGAPGPPR